jgi:hypothetical protein
MNQAFEETWNQFPFAQELDLEFFFLFNILMKEMGLSSTWMDVFLGVL